MTHTIAKLLNRIALPALPIYFVLHAAVAWGVL